MIKAGSGNVHYRVHGHCLIGGLALAPESAVSSTYDFPDLEATR